MSSHNSQRVRFTIASSGTDSEYLSSKFSAGVLKTLLGSTIQMVVFMPSALTGVVTMQIRQDEATGTPVTLQDPAGTDITFAAGKAVVVNVAAFKDFRFHSASAEGAERLIDVVFQIGVTE